MKKWLKIALGVVAVVVLVITAVFYLTSGIVDTADAFFKAVKQKDIAKARSYFAEDFKASVDENALKTFLSQATIINFKEASWSNRQISGGRGELDGTITTETGGVVPIKMMFVKEKDRWKIYAIQKPTAGLQSADTSPTLPNERDQTALVKQSIHDFLVSVKNKSMEHFRTTVSQLWQNQSTTEQLNEAFKPIFNVNWSGLDRVDPVLSSESKVEENGVLVLDGYYPTTPRIRFEQKYVYEGVSWKLLGFYISTTKT